MVFKICTIGNNIYDESDDAKKNQYNLKDPKWDPQAP